MKTTFTYLILCIILNFAVTGPVPEKKLIFDDLINFAKNTCLDLVTTPLFNRSTKYLSLCNKEPSSNLNKYNSDEYLCLGILDANYRLCKTKHDSGNKTISIPKTDAEIEKVVNESNGISENICKNFSKYPLEYKFNDLIKSNLNVIFNNDTICMKACDDFVKINPLCLFINLINSEIDSLKSQTHPTVEKKLEIVTAPANDNQRLQSVITKPKPLMQNVTNVQQRPDKPVQNPTNTKSSAPGAVTVEMKNEKSLTPENVPTAIKKPEIQGNSEVLSSEKSKVQTEDLIIQETQKPEDNKENKPEPQKPLTSDEFNDNGLDEDGNVNDIDYQETSPANDLPPKIDEFTREMPKPIPKHRYEDNMDLQEIEESNFFTYFMFISAIFICGYIAYHNKQKILALILEGRKDRNGRRRPNSAGYRKLNSNLEEAVTSKSGGSATHVIY